MPRITLPLQKGADTQNWVDLRSPDDFMAADLFAMHAAVKIKTGPTGAPLDYSAQEMADDQVNAFLVGAVVAWSFPTPVPAQNGVAAGDVVIGRAMKAKEWTALRKAARPLMNELEGEEDSDTKSGDGAADPDLPVPGEPAG
jgi:hypothetical protein